MFPVASAVIISFGEVVLMTGYIIENSVFHKTKYCFNF